MLEIRGRFPANILPNRNFCAGLLENALETVSLKGRQAGLGRVRVLTTIQL